MTIANDYLSALDYEIKKMQTEIDSLRKTKIMYNASLKEKILGRISINEMVSDVHQNAIKHGWWEEVRSFGELIALCHSELSEALEDLRNGKEITAVWQDEKGKPCGIPTELADVVIRVMDICGYYDIDLEHVLKEKHDYNITRPYKHGGKVI